MDYPGDSIIARPVSTLCLCQWLLGFLRIRYSLSPLNLPAAFLLRAFVLRVVYLLVSTTQTNSDPIPFQASRLAFDSLPFRVLRFAFLNPEGQARLRRKLKLGPGT